MLKSLLTSDHLARPSANNRSGHVRVLPRAFCLHIGQRKVLLSIASDLTATPFLMTGMGSRAVTSALAASGVAFGAHRGIMTGARLGVRRRQG
jgi:hypothetical protein